MILQLVFQGEQKSIDWAWWSMWSLRTAISRPVQSTIFA